MIKNKGMIENKHLVFAALGLVVISALTYVEYTKNIFGCFNDVKITKFSDIKGLPDLTRAFFSRPEFVGGINLDEGEKFPSCSLSKEAFREAIDTFGETFEHNQAFHTPKNWIGDVVNNAKVPTPLNFDYSIESPTVRYVQKVIVNSGSTFCFMGDLHSSVHTLIRSLWRLVKLGHLNKDLTVKNKNFYMVFLGDYVDRGRWGVEVIMTLMKLKLQNWNNMFFVAGNHETGGVPLLMGFHNEIKSKFPQGGKLFWSLYRKVFMNLPVAVFLQCGKNVVQCCHGGIEEDFMPLEFLKNETKLFQNVGKEEFCRGLFWSDFCASNPTGHHSRRAKNVFLADQKSTKEYLTKNGMKAFMRAHQDDEFGLKVFFDSSHEPACDNSIKTNRYEKDCLYHWTTVVERLGITDHTFPVSKFDHYPVFTFTSAVEARKFPFDCFGLVEAYDSWDKWMMHVYEMFLDKKGKEFRHKKFVHVGASSNANETDLVMPVGPHGKDPIEVMWKSSFNEKALEHGMNAIISAT